jgi:hypothetical protein
VKGAGKPGANPLPAGAIDGHGGGMGLGNLGGQGLVVRRGRGGVDLAGRAAGAAAPLLPPASGPAWQRQAVGAFWMPQASPLARQGCEAWVSAGAAKSSKANIIVHALRNK